MAHTPAGVVLTGTQEAWGANGGPGKFWEEKPNAGHAAPSVSYASNAGYSGTPLWKLRAEMEAQVQAAEAAGSSKPRVPDGFVKQRGETNLYWSEKRQLFWKDTDARYYVWDDLAQAHVELHEAGSHDVSVAVGGVCHERATQVKNVIVKDLIKAATAMRLSMDHLDQPCAMYALYDGHRGGAKGNACAEFCAKHLHGKLLPKLAAFRGYWVDDRLKSALRESFEELDASFLEKHPGVNDGCSAAVALLVGDRLVVASIGDIACCACMRSGETVRLARAHAMPDPDAEDDSDDEAEAEEEKPAEAASGSGRAVPWTRSFGDADLKTPSLGAMRLLPTPEVTVLKLDQQHQGFAFVCRALFQSIGRGVAVATVFRRGAGRPRMAAGALIDAAVQYLGQVGQDTGLASVVAFLDIRSDDPSASSSGPPAAKRRKSDEPTQVRLRHILMKHKECKSTVDKVRNRQVRRTRGEAERILRGILEEVEGDSGRKIFTQRCRDLSECQSCLKAGDLAGDVSWVKRGDKKFPEAFETTAFGLKVNQMSDLIDSDQGVHIVLRTA